MVAGYVVVYCITSIIAGAWNVRRFWSEPALREQA